MLKMAISDLNFLASISSSDANIDKTNLLLAGQSSGQNLFVLELLPLPPSLPGVFVLLPPGGSLVSEHPCPGPRVLFLMDVLDQNPLVLVRVTLGFKVEFVVHMAVDFLVLALFLEETSEDAHALHPDLFFVGPGVGGTLAATGTGTTALSFGDEGGAHASTGVHGNLLLDDEAVFNVASNMMPGVVITNSQRFVRVQPDLVLTATEDLGGQSFLKLQV